VTGLIARPAILALATIPLAVRCVRGLRRDYDDPYALMFSTMGKNIQLHLYTGLLLFAGYIVSIVADRIMDPAPGWLL
jgi:1,4-dihydroxy-2-naphthoate octaprenyltransferase